MNYTNVLEGLENATLFDMYRLLHALNNEIENPDKIRLIKNNLRVGQIVSYYNNKINILEDVEIINLDNKLPLRATINYQIWVGAGIEYKLGSNSSIVIEPLFKHYFKSLYSETAYKVHTSGFALRIGFNYKIKY